VSDFIARNWRGSGVPVTFVHNAVPAIFAAPNELPAGPVRCLIAGRLEHDKGHHLAVESVIRARETGLDVRLDVFGGPLEGNPYASDLTERVRTTGCGDAIRFLGFQSDLRSRHQQYHLGLQCRLAPEPCSMWVCETLADGLPLVASDSGGTPELVADGETGLLFPSGNLECMTARLIELARDPQRMHAMRVAAFEHGKRHFTVDRFVRETIAAYNSIDGKRRT
jgi:glycosyltransferase involved in cell wall biosynthesis